MIACVLGIESVVTISIPKLSEGFGAGAPVAFVAVRDACNWCKLRREQAIKLGPRPAGNRLIAFESFNFIFALLGIAAVYLNKDSPQLTYYKTAVYPVYIVHLPVQMAVMYFFAGSNIHPIIKFPIALFLICFLSLTIYHAVKNIKLLRPLFGLRNK